MKVKGREYMEVSRLLSASSPRSLWRTMVDGRIPLPSNADGRVVAMARDIESDYSAMRDVVNDVWSKVSHIHDQKEFALTIMGDPRRRRLSAALFAMKAKKEKALDEAIAALVEPSGKAGTTTVI